jgi:hypothetical protein
MFRRFVRMPPPPKANDPETPISPQKAEQIFRTHPSELAALLELAWEFRQWNGNLDLGHPNRRSDIPQLPEYLLQALFGNEVNQFVQTNKGCFFPSNTGMVGPH